MFSVVLLRLAMSDEQTKWHRYLFDDLHRWEHERLVDYLKRFDLVYENAGPYPFYSKLESNRLFATAGLSIRETRELVKMAGIHVEAVKYAMSFYSDKFSSGVVFDARAAILRPRREVVMEDLVIQFESLAWYYDPNREVRAWQEKFHDSE